MNYSIINVKIESQKLNIKDINFINSIKSIAVIGPSSSSTTNLKKNQKSAKFRIIYDISHLIFYNRLILIGPNPHILQEGKFYLS